MNLLVYFPVLSLFCFYSLLLGTDAGKHGNLLKAAESTETNIPDQLLSEFYIGIDSQEDKYTEAIEKAKARKSHRKKAPQRIKINTENELTVGRRNLHKTHRKKENISKSTLDVGDSAKFSRKHINKNNTKSKKTKNLRKSHNKNSYKRITPDVGDYSPIDIIIHIKMREPKKGAAVEAK